jgi:hypothetical protein
VAPFLPQVAEVLRRRRSASTSLALAGSGATGSSSGSAAMTSHQALILTRVTTSTTSPRMSRRCPCPDPTRGSRGAHSRIAAWYSHWLQSRSRLPVVLLPPAHLAVSATLQKPATSVQRAARNTSLTARHVIAASKRNARTTSATLPRPATSVQSAASRTFPMAAPATPA